MEISTDLNPLKHRQQAAWDLYRDERVRHVAARPKKNLTELLHRMNRSGDRALVVPSEYLEIVITRSPS